jgi:hypothetical protein
MKRGDLPLVLIFAVACADSADVPNATPDAGEPPIVEDAGVLRPAFTSATPPDGAGMWIAGTLDGNTATVELWAQSLGGVFGWSTHVRWDASHLAYDEAASSALAEWTIALDPEGAGAVDLVGTRNLAGGDLALGATRLRTRESATEVTIDAPVRLGRFVLTAGEGESAIDLERVIVRRADGSHVAVEVRGARVRTGGAS